MVIKNKSTFSMLFDIINYILLALIAIITILPFIYVFAGSFTATEELIAKKFVLFPTKFSFDAYRYIFSTPTFVRSLLVSIYITVVGTFINILFTGITAYALAHKNIMGRRIIMLGITFTLLFNGGMIPNFLVVRSMNLLDTLWSLLIPGAISAYNLILMKNFFQQLPKELEESAKIDGYNELAIFFKIIVPVSTPAIATFTIFYAVGHWNTFFNALMYINDSQKWPVQVLLRQTVIMSQGGLGDADAISQQMAEKFIVPPETVKLATIVISTVPILLIYPFFQKHFTQGLMLGSVKG